MAFLDQILQQKYEFSVKTGKTPSKVMVPSSIYPKLLDEFKNENISSVKELKSVYGLKVEIDERLKTIEVR